jgi:hypothetical protein
MLKLFKLNKRYKSYGMIYQANINHKEQISTLNDKFNIHVEQYNMDNVNLHSKYNNLLYLIEKNDTDFLNMEIDYCDLKEDIIYLEQNNIELKQKLDYLEEEVNNLKGLFKTK